MATGTSSVFASFFTVLTCGSTLPSTSQSYIARLELGNVDPQVSTVTKLARALGVPVAAVVEAILPEDEQ